MPSISAILLLACIGFPVDKLNSGAQVPNPAQPVVADVAAPAAKPDSSDQKPATDEKTWSLRYVFQQGQQWRYQSDQKMTLEAQVGENRRVDISQVQQVRLFTVQSVEPDGAGTFAMQFEKVSMKRQVDDQPAVEFHTGMKPSEIPEVYRGVAHSLRGSAPEFRLTTTGQTVRKPRNAAPTVVQAAVPSPVETTETPASEVKPVSAATTESSKSKDPGSFLMPLPDQPVRIGDSWKEEFPLTVRGSQDLNLQVVVLRTYRLEKVEGDTATVTFRSSVKTPIRSSAVQSQLIQATPSGQFRLDMKRGVMTSREYRYSETVIGALGAESLLTSYGTQQETLLETVAQSSTPTEK